MKTKHTLLTTAEHLVRARGFDAISYADLAQEVGIRKASIHYHFATKADLAAALIERYSADFLARLAAISDRNVTAAEDVIAYLDLYREALGNGTQLCLCVSYSASRDSFDDATLAHLNQFHDRSLTWLTTAWEKARHDGSISGPMARPEEEAQACLALVEGAQLIARAAGSEALFNAATAALRARLSLRNPQ